MLCVLGGHCRKRLWTKLITDSGCLLKLVNAADVTHCEFDVWFIRQPPSISILVSSKEWLRDTQPDAHSTSDTEGSDECWGNSREREREGERVNVYLKYLKIYTGHHNNRPNTKFILICFTKFVRAGILLLSYASTRKMYKCEFKSLT